MYTKNKYSLWSTINWSMKYVYFAIGYSFVGFKNNNAYDRTWEARKIWGGIVNDSRSFASEVTSLISDPHMHQELSSTSSICLKVLLADHYVRGNTSFWIRLCS